MKIKRLCAVNIREAMRKVREELGPNAVILSNHRVDNGVEIVAAVDYDERLIEKMQQPGAQATSAGGSPDTASTGAVGAGTPRPKAAGSHVAADPVKPGTQALEAGTEAVKPRIVWSQDPMLVDMQTEIKTMRHLLEQQLSGLAWGDMARRQPCRAELLGRLMKFGLDTELCLRLADAVADEGELERAWALALQTLAQGLSVTQDDILTRGGVVALVGPTGVGKTTTVAKLAARYTMRHGSRRVALITTDSYRIGAFDQLRTFGMILDIPVRLAGNHGELRAAVSEFADKSLILIDTAGMSQRDLRLSQQFTLIGAEPGARSYLVMAANAQASTLDETVEAFAKAQLAGCILTKLDETNRLGGALSVIHGRGLSLAYVSNGQRVPEDLQAARVEALVRMGAELMPGGGAAAGRETLALTFGRKVANAYL